MVTKLKKASIAIRQNKGRDLSPKWDDHETMTADQFSRHFRMAMNWYRLETSGKELKPKVVNWMSSQDYPKDIIKAFKNTKDNRCGTTVGAIAANLLRGMPAIRADFNEGRNTAEWLSKAIAKIIEVGKHDEVEPEDGAVEVKPAVYTPSIQERLRDVAIGMTEEIEDAIESFQTDPESFDPKAFKLLNLLRGRQAKAAHARIIKDLYSRNYEELVEAATTKDEQLKEGYSHLSKANLKKITLFYSEILSACDMLAQEAKVNRAPRAKKAKPVEKIIAKLKYQKSNEPLKLVSINPADIVVAKELWLYNTMTGKLGKYEAAEYLELSVKGTSIIGFNENLSVQKTLRKPEEQLKEFKAAGKVQLRKFLDDIKAVDIKLNGRINEEVVLLRVQ
jgi:hypothetical protein